MLPGMKEASELVARVRAESGLSQRALAGRVGCTRSTITRIESGQMDPTVTMLARIASAAGHRLLIEVTQPGGAPRLAEVAERTKDIDAIDWTHLRGIVDWLRLHPGDVPAAIIDAPPRTGDARVDNLVAAVAEKVADDSGHDRPRWARSVPVLATPWSPPGTPRMQAAEAASAPRQFASRNLLLGAQNLWRAKPDA